MINFKPLQLNAEILTIVKNLGTSLSFKTSENVKAEVVDVLPSGAAVLRVKNGYITVNTEIPLTKDYQLLLKVLEPRDNKLQFQLISIENKENVNLKNSILTEISPIVLLENLDSLPESIKSEITKNILSSILELENKIDLPRSETNLINQEIIKESIKNSGTFFENKLLKFFNTLEEIKNSNPEVYKELFNAGKDLTKKLETLINNQDKNVELLKILKETIDSIFSDAKLKINDENFQKLITNYSQLSLLNDVLVGIFPFVFSDIKISKYEIKKKVLENGVVFYFRGNIEFEDNTNVSYIIARYLDGYYITIKTNNEEMLNNLRLLKKETLDNLKDLNVVSFDIYG